MSNAVALYRNFEAELSQRQEELTKILPPHIPRDRFMTTALIAIKNEPSLLNANRRTLHQAITEAAEDGLHPDGREGTITVFKGEAVWNPMIYGLRKRAIELAGIIIDAQVVYEKDSFIWHQGDEPRIEHIPAKLGSDRGEGIGAYAIFKQNGVVLHREVLDKLAIERVRSISRAKDGPLWTKWWTEAWRKTAVRRGIKTLPVVPDLERIIKREDRDFDFGQRPQQQQAPALTVVPSPPKKEQPPTIDAVAEEPNELAGQPEDMGPAGGPEQGQEEAPAPAAKAPPAGGNHPKSTLDAFIDACNAAETVAALNGVWELWDKKLKGKERARAQDVFGNRFNDITGG